MFINDYLQKIKLKSINNDKKINIECNIYNLNTINYILNTMYNYNLYQFNEIILSLYYINKLSNICFINNDNLNIIYISCLMLSNKFIKYMHVY